MNEKFTEFCEPRYHPDHSQTKKNSEFRMPTGTAMPPTHEAFQRIKYERPILSALYKLEESTFALRKEAKDLLAMEDPSQYEKVKDKITALYHFSLKIQDSDITRIALPCLLPHYKDKHMSCMIEPLYHFLSQNEKEGNLIRYQSIVMSVINHVSKTKPRYQIRNNDSYEYRNLVNSLAFWFLTNYDYQSCELFNATSIDEADYTEVFLVPKEKFAEWYSQIRKKMVA